MTGIIIRARPFPIGRIVGRQWHGISISITSPSNAILILSEHERSPFRSVLSGSGFRAAEKRFGSTSASCRYARLKLETSALVERASRKVRGSAKHDNLRKRHCAVVCEAVREGLLCNSNEYSSNKYSSSCSSNENVSDNDNDNDNDNARYSDGFCAATRELTDSLGGVGADLGIMPPFTDPRALRGYTLGHFGRARLVSELASQSEPEWLADAVSGAFAGADDHDHDPAIDDDIDDHQLRVASLGGGCGYDFVALAALSAFLGGPRIAATVYEYEPAWREVVADVESVLADVLRATATAAPHQTTTAVTTAAASHRCGFERCDIASPLDAACNETLASDVGSTRVFSCSYVVAENAVALRSQNFGFFRQLFAEAPEGSLFFFAETTHRLWPELIEVARSTKGHDSSSSSSSMRVSIPHIRCGKSGWQLALLKDSAASVRHGQGQRQRQHFLDDRQQTLCERFRNDNLAHLSRLERGWKRHARKARGAKQ